MEKLLVTMTGHDPIEKLMSCLEILARPAMTVIFLFPYPVDSSSYFRVLLGFLWIHVQFSAEEQNRYPEVLKFPEPSCC